MPARNIVKEYDDEAYYHIYNRGVNKKLIFREDEDYVVFLNLLKRCFSEKPEKDKYFREYPNYSKDLELLAFCLMPNHFHLLVYQEGDVRAIEKAMRSISTSYSRYFNKKYGRVGHLFQGAYKATRISSSGYLEHISRYIHLNPKNWQDYEWSSLPYYIDKKHSDWLRPNRVLEIFDNNKTTYINFVNDYEDYKKELDDIKHSLADH